MLSAPLPVKIAGLGIYLPEQRVTSTSLEHALDLPAGWIERRTGVRERRFNSGETASFMAAQAVRDALTMAGRDVAEVEAFVGASSGPQQLIPCTAVFVQRELDAPEGRSACFDLNATCLSFPVALYQMAHFIAAGVYRTVVLFSTEIASRSLNPAQKESYVLFGDGAAAAVLTRAEPGEVAAIHYAHFATFHSGAEHTQFLGAGSKHPPNAVTTTPEMNVFDMDGPAVFRQGTRLIGPFLDDFFTAVAWRRDENLTVVPHQASRHALEQLTSRLGFRDEQVVVNIAQRGNCIAASIPIALTEAVREGRIVRGNRVLLVGTGAGLTLGALALTF
jgi:3-oxoacyl-[acyl-carrier-protein] synthase III